LIIEPPSTKSRRYLILISKVIQSISNCSGNVTDLEEKESYMRSFSSFIQSYKEPTVRFFDELAVWIF
jgi:hypothetical protein